MQTQLKYKYNVFKNITHDEPKVHMEKLRIKKTPKL